MASAIHGLALPEISVDSHGQGLNLSPWQINGTMAENWRFYPHF